MAARRFTKAVKERLDYLEKRGLLHPDSIVKDATPKDSPLHPKFNWNNATAGHAHRLQQARELVHHFRIVITGDHGNRRSAPQYVSVVVRGKRQYRNLSVVINNKDMRRQLLEDAVRDMRVFADKYQTLKELSGVKIEIGKALRKLSREIAA